MVALAQHNAMITRKSGPRRAMQDYYSHALLSWLIFASTVPLTLASLPGSWSEGIYQLPLAVSAASRPARQPSMSSKAHRFSLRHVVYHGVYDNPNLHIRRDIPAPSPVDVASEEGTPDQPMVFRAKSKSEYIERMSDRSVRTVNSMYHEARAQGQSAMLDPSAWVIDEVQGPNTSDKDTVISLAKMAWNAYQEGPGVGEWQDMNKEPFNFSQSFGWDSDGLRGHIFVNEDNSTIIASLKGTTPAVFDGSGTTTKDKVNDNLFFSCCCGLGRLLWHSVCDCKTEAYTCNQTCLVTALKEKNHYYTASVELYGNITELYPNSQVWLVGHSLGGSTSALLGLTFGVPTTTFEAPGEAMAAARLGLPAPPSYYPSSHQARQYTGAYHFGHTADPIFMGSCNAATSACTLGGYAMESQCHTGHVCVYDTVGDKQWRVGAGYHKIATVIHDVIEAYDEIATCHYDDECVDCFNWKYFESNGSDSTTTSSFTTPSAAPTRTTTCQTPGWWGCLDETTTTSSGFTTTKTTETSSFPSTSCLRYGW